MTTFRYRREPSVAFGSILRPVANLFLSTKAATLEVAMYIDSGADMTLIPFLLGRSLGFRQRSTDRVLELSGISGAGVPYVLRTARIRIGHHALTIRVAWALIEDVPLLLGRVDLFPRFQILFDERARQVVFTPGPSRRSRSSRKAPPSILAETGVYCQDCGGLGQDDLRGRTGQLFL